VIKLRIYLRYNTLSEYSLIVSEFSAFFYSTVPNVNLAFHYHGFVSCWLRGDAWEISRRCKKHDRELMPSYWEFDERNCHGDHDVPWTHRAHGLLNRIQWYKTWKRTYNKKIYLRIWMHSLIFLIKKSLINPLQSHVWIP